MNNFRFYSSSMYALMSSIDISLLFLGGVCWAAIVVNSLQNIGDRLVRKICDTLSWNIYCQRQKFGIEHVNSARELDCTKARYKTYRHWYAGVSEGLFCKLSRSTMSFAPSILLGFIGALHGFFFISFLPHAALLSTVSWNLKIPWGPMFELYIFSVSKHMKHWYSS